MTEKKTKLNKLNPNFAYAIIAILSVGLLLYTAIEVSNCKSDIKQISYNIKQLELIKNSDGISDKMEKNVNNEFDNLKNIDENFQNVDIKVKEDLNDLENKDNEEKNKFGIDDSGLKFNSDGSIDDRDWKTYKVGAVEFRYPSDWFEVERGVSNNNSLEVIKQSNNNLVKITFFGAPFDIGWNSERLSKEEFERIANELKQQKITKFKKNVIKCKDDILTIDNVILDCVKEKNSKILKEYLKINKKNGIWHDSTFVEIEMNNKKSLVENKQIIDYIISTLFIFDEKFMR